MWRSLIWLKNSRLFIGPGKFENVTGTLVLLSSSENAKICQEEVVEQALGNVDDKIVLYFRLRVAGCRPEAIVQTLQSLGAAGVVEVDRNVRGFSTYLYVT